jgi:hypothetical protein
MLHEEFIGLLEMELRLRGVGFHRATLAEFVEASWPLMQEDQDGGLWARKFIAGGNATLPA